MKQEITVRFAGIGIGISSRFDFMERFCKEYLTDEMPVFSVSVTDEQRTAELQIATEPTTEEYAEALCLYREIAERIPLFDRVVFHGAAIAYEGKAYIFTAPSKTGKSTHVRLWKQVFGEKVTIINGDKPILSLKDGNITVHGTPFAGKENWQNNVSAPLGGICFLMQGKNNTISPVSPKDAFTKLCLQTYKPYSEEAAEKTLEIIRRICTYPCFHLSCDISENAVKASFAALVKGESK